MASTTLPRLEKEKRTISGLGKGEFRRSLRVYEAGAPFLEELGSVPIVSVFDALMRAVMIDDNVINLHEILEDLDKVGKDVDLQPLLRCRSLLKMVGRWQGCKTVLSIVLNRLAVILLALSQGERDRANHSIMYLKKWALPLTLSEDEVEKSESDSDSDED